MNSCKSERNLYENKKRLTVNRAPRFEMIPDQRLSVFLANSPLINAWAAAIAPAMSAIGIAKKLMREMSHSCGVHSDS